MIGAIRRHSAFFAALAVVAAFYYVWAWSDRVGQLGTDGTWYLMMAASYSPFSVPDPVYVAAAQESRFPPLYPLLLAMLGGAENLRLAYVISTTCFVLALAACYGWYSEIGLAGRRAAVCALVFAMLPGSYLQALYPQSEYLYLLLSFTALWLLERHTRSGCLRDLVGAALIVGAACLTRTIGISLIAPLALQAVRSRRPSGFLTVLAACSAPVLWHVVHHTEFGYGRLAADLYTGLTPAMLWTQCVDMWTALRFGFARNVIDLGGMFLMTQLLGALMLGAALWRCARLTPDGVYSVAYLSILLFWPFPEESARFVWVIIPVGLGQSMLVASRISNLLHTRHAYAQALLVGSIILLALPTLAIVASRYQAGEANGANRYLAWYDPDPAQALISTRTAQTIVEGLEGTSRLVPAGQCVFSIKPDLVNYYAHRASTLPPVATANDADFDAAMRQSTCLYVAMISATQRVYPVPMYPAQHIERYSDTLDVRGFAANGQDYTTFMLARLK